MSLRECISLLGINAHSLHRVCVLHLIDNCAKDHGPVEVRILCSFNHGPLCI